MMSLLSAFSPFRQPPARLPRGLAALLLLPALAGCGTQARNAADVQQDLGEAQRHAQVDPDDKQARQWADRAIALAPNDPATFLGDTDPSAPRAGVAQVFSSVGDDPALADYMTQAMGKFPADYRAGLLLTDALGRLGRDADRKAAAQKMVAALPPTLLKPGASDLTDRTVALGQAYFGAGDPVRGASVLQKAIQAYPTDPEPPNALAYNWAEANTNLPQALALAQQALALAAKKTYTDDEAADLEKAELLDTLGWVQYRQGDFKNAAQNLQEATALVPRLAETRYHLGMAYVALGQPEAARAELGHAVLLSQGYAAAEAAYKALPAAPNPGPTGAGG